MPETTVGHSKAAPDPWECLPGSMHQLRRTELANLRCGSYLREPGGLKEDVVHVWTHRGVEIARKTPERLACDGDGVVFRSFLPADELPADPVGPWTCTTMTVGGQLVGLRQFEILTADGKSLEELAGASSAALGSGVGSAAGSGSAAAGGGSGGSGGSAGSAGTAGSAAGSDAKR
jgi:hypothetical protein